MASTDAATPLPTALIDYFEARNAALIAARKYLGVGELDARALLYISDNPSSRPRDLADYLGITSAGATALTDRLVNRDAIRRDVDADDRRVVRLTAIVDLTREPWSALKVFDDHIQTASGEVDGDGAIGRALARLTESAATAAAAAEAAR